MRIVKRPTRRFGVLAVAIAVFAATVTAACDTRAGDRGDAASPDAGEPDPYPWGELTVQGQAYFFDLGPGLSVDYQEDGPEAEVWVLGHPELRQTIGADGRFSFDGFAVGMEVTLCVEAPAFHATQTGTLTVGATGLAGVTFQVMSFDIVDAVTNVLLTVELDDNTCQIATTVTAADTQSMGNWAPGEPGAVVELTPGVEPESGPFYFNEDVMPMAIYTETSIDGGVLYVNVPEGEYVLRGFKQGVSFTPVKVKCRAGWLVNASPPYGVQAL